jgi:hypothetical protein
MSSFDDGLVTPAAPQCRFAQVRIYLHFGVVRLFEDINRACVKSYTFQCQYALRGWNFHRKYGVESLYLRDEHGQQRLRQNTRCAILGASGALVTQTVHDACMGFGARPRLQPHTPYQLRMYLDCFWYETPALGRPITASLCS